MASPSFSGGISSTLTVTGSNLADVSTVNGITVDNWDSVNTSAGISFRNNGGQTINNYQGGVASFSTQDFSATGRLMAISFQLTDQANRLDSIGDVDDATAGLAYLAIDGDGDWAAWELGGDQMTFDAVDVSDAFVTAVLDLNDTSSAFDTGGTFNPADVVTIQAMIYAIKSESSLRHNFEYVAILDPIVAVEGEAADPIDFAAFALYAAGQDIQSVQSQGALAFASVTRLAIGDGGATTVYARDAARAVEFRGNATTSTTDILRHYGSGFLGLTFDVTSTFDVQFTNSTFSGGTPWFLTVTPNGNTSETLTLTGCLFNNAATVTLDTPANCANSAFTSCGEVTPNAADLSNCRIADSTNATGAIVWDDSATLTGLVFEGNTVDIRIPVGASASITFTNITESANALTVRDERTGSPEIIVSGGATPTVTNTVGGVTTSVSASNTLTLTGIETGSKVRFYTGSQGASAVDIGGTDSSSGDVVLSHSSATVAGFVTIMKTGFNYLKLDVTYASGAVSQSVEQSIDRAYDNAA